MRRAPALLRMLVFLGLCSFLSSCGSNLEVRTNDDNGITSIASRLVILDRVEDAQFGARALWQSRGERTIHAIHVTVHRYDGNYAQIRHAYANKQPVNYLLLDRQLSHCNIRCVWEETGLILITASAFHDAAHANGVTLGLSGLRGSYRGRLPGRAFAEVLDRIENIEAKETSTADIRDGILP